MHTTALGGVGRRDDGSDVAAKAATRSTSDSDSITATEEPADRKLITKQPAGRPAATGNGTGDARDEFSRAYEELRRIAGLWFRGQPAQHTLQPTALVHEAFLRIAQSDAQYRDPTHLLATVARAMRQILVDYARQRSASKRGRGKNRILMVEAEALVASDDSSTAIDIEDLHDMLERLRALSPRQAEIVELRYFGGLTVDETAMVIGVAPRTVKLDWQFARAWLRGQLSRTGE